MDDRIDRLQAALTQEIERAVAGIISQGLTNLSEVSKAMDILGKLNKLRREDDERLERDPGGAGCDDRDYISENPILGSLSDEAWRTKSSDFDTE